MPAIVTNKIRLSTAKQFVESFDEASPTSYYLFIGKSTPWNDDLTPAVPVDSTDLQYYVHEDIIFMKKLQANNISHAIRRYNWTSGVYYRQYTDNADLFATVNRTSAGSPNVGDVTPFYVVTTTNDEYRIYKCLSNKNNSASTIDPATVDTGIGEGGGVGDNGLIYCTDGYIWKFMYSVSDADMLKFVTSDWVPVRIVKVNDGSRHWTVQNNARDGAIEVIQVTTPGTEYVSAPTLTIDYPHKGGTRAVTQSLSLIDGKVQTPIKMTTVGTYYYKKPTITVSFGNLAVEAILSPKGGHGFDAVSELGGIAVMIYVELSGSESNNLITVNDYRRIGIMVDPIELNTIGTATGYVSSSFPPLTYLSGYSASTNPTTENNNIKIATAPPGTILGKEIVILSGPGKGERRRIIGFEQSVNMLLLDRNWTTTPDQRPTTSTKYGLVTSSSTENDLYKLTLTGNSTPSAFAVDATITSTTSGTKTAKVVQYVPATLTEAAYVLVNEVSTSSSDLYDQKVFNDADVISDGSATPNTATIATSGVTKLGSESYYGDVIYLENRRPINRAPDQTEEIRIVLEF